MGFQQGLSGLNGASKNLDVIGNNVANANTVGFKQSQAQFADVYANSLGGSAGSAVGIGTKLATVAQQFGQGNISSTSNPLDMAISQQGFFQMDNNGAIIYSRNGQFQLDKDGYIVNSQGHNLTGYSADPLTGTILQGSVGPLQIPTQAITPQPTTTSQVGVNLDSRSTVPTGLGRGNVVGSAAAGLTILVTNNQLTVTVDGTLSGTVTIPPAVYASATALASAVQTAVNADPALIAAGKSVTVTAGATGILTMASNSAGATSTIAVANVVAGTVANLFGAAPVVTTGSGAFNPTDPTTYNSSTSMTIYDSLGNNHIASLYFQKTPVANVWNTYMTVDNLPTSGTVTVPPSGTFLGQLVFSTTGTLTAPALGAVTVPAGGIVYANGSTTPQPLSFDLATTTQFGKIFGVDKLTQNGYTSGQLNGFSTSADGTIMGRYTNGQSRALGQVLLANFANPQGLQPLGNNEWSNTADSGQALVGVPGTANLGVLQSNAVEEANVDLTAELVNMIIAQRVYQANAQTIKAQDAILQTLVNLR